MKNKNEGDSKKGSRSAVAIDELNDLVALTDADLVACLTALRQELIAQRWKHEAAVASGAVSDGVSFRFDRFVWKRATRSGKPWAGPIGADTPIADLPFPRRPLDSLRAHGMEFLRDLAKACERDLLSYQDLGPTTVAELRRLLEGVGLAFATPPANEAGERQLNVALRQLSAEDLRAARAQLDDAAPTSRLGLYPRTLSQCVQAGWITVGALRTAPLADMAECLGKASLREVLQALEQTSLGLGPGRTPLALWRVGALPASNLARPTSRATPIEACEPWLGAVVKVLASADVLTLADLIDAHKKGVLARMAGLARRDLNALNTFVADMKVSADLGFAAEAGVLGKAQDGAISSSR